MLSLTEATGLPSILRMQMLTAEPCRALLLQSDCNCACFLRSEAKRERPHSSAASISVNFFKFIF